MYSAGVACYAICIHCLLLLGRFDAREGGGEGGRERDGIVVARQPFRRYRAVDNEDSCSWKFARVVWPSCVLSKYRKSRFHVSSIVEPSSLIGQLVSN